VAEISGTARETDSAYAAAVRIRSTGLAAAFARVRFDMQVEGFPKPTRCARSAIAKRRRYRVSGRSGGVALARRAGPVLLSDPPDVEAGVGRLRR
jgi:hypothetical protein